jgi:hypothetical protein
VRRCTIVLLLAALSAAGGCATLVTGTTQNVRIISQPSGAALRIGERDAATPAVLALARDRDYNVIVRKPGYVVARRKLLQHRNPWTSGNVLSFGSLGLVIDQATGAAYAFAEPTLVVALIRQPVDPPQAIRADPERFGYKIRLDLAAFDDAGLTGPPDGRRAGAYAFCIPALAEEEAVVRALDPTIGVQRGARGPMGCAIPDEVLCIGSTQQPAFREVLHSLAALPYVSSIEPFHGE